MEKMSQAMIDFLHCDMGEQVLDWFQRKLDEERDQAIKTTTEGYEEAWKVIQHLQKENEKLKNDHANCTDHSS